MEHEEGWTAPIPTIPRSSGIASESPGATASGFRFVPSDGSFGFKAMVVLGTHPSPVAFNADVALEMELQRTTTGVSMGRITLNGNGYMMAEITEREKAKVTCTADITYDFPTSTLHGVFDAIINATPVTGSRTDGHACRAEYVVHEDRRTVQPDQAPARELAHDGRLSDARQEPSAASAPAAACPCDPRCPPANRDTRIAAGNGLALGASMSFTTGRQYYFIFYGDVSAGGGFDIALLKQTKCEGINGWQAQGQLYAYVDASVGLACGHRFLCVLSVRTLVVRPTLPVVPQRLCGLQRRLRDPRHPCRRTSRSGRTETTLGHRHRQRTVLDSRRTRKGGLLLQVQQGHGVQTMTTHMEQGRTRSRGLVLAVTLLFLGGTHLAAQETPMTQDSGATAGPAVGQFHDPGFTKIMVLARADKDSVVLRWAPGTPHGWRVANRTGYVVERRSGNGAFVRLTPDTLHPWSAFRFIDSMREHTDHPYLGLVLNALWADSVLLEPDGADTLEENAARNTNLFGYALFAADNDPAIADAMGLRYVDRTVKTGDRYTYRIRLNEPREYRIDPGEVEVVIGAAKKTPPPVNLTARGLEHRIELRWDPQPTDEYTGYLVSRSADGGKKFRQMNRTPIVIVTASDTAMAAQGGFTDTTVVNYKVYRYRVQGITAFGERGASAEVKASGRDMTPPPPPLVKNPTQAGRTTVVLEWEMPATTPDLAGFVISRSAQPDSNYHDLTRKPLPKKTRQFTDKNADDAEPYYIVAAIDTAGNRASSFPLLGALIDTLPPAVPTGFRGVVDTAGLVHLSWNRNRERTILGYRVLRANAPDHEFTQLTGEVWRDTMFTDTVDVRTLTRNVYYRIAAVNLRYNHSRPTATLALRRPDTTPPEAPVFSDVQVTDSSVALRWAPSASADVQAHVLSRRVSPKDTWFQLAALARGASQYIDRAVQRNIMYEYRIEAVDSSGLRSPARLTVQARPFDTGVRPAVKDVAAVYGATNNTIMLSWSYSPAKSESAYFVVYRSRNGSPLIRYRAVDFDQKGFIDREITGTGTYEYAVKVMTQSGAESPLSERVRVQVQDK